MTARVICGVCGGDGQTGMYHDGQPKVCEDCEGRGYVLVGGAPLHAIEDRALLGQPAE